MVASCVFNLVLELASSFFLELGFLLLFQEFNVGFVVDYFVDIMVCDRPSEVLI